MKKSISFVKKIVVFGGFNAINAGDEAQIAQTYKELKEHFSEYEIKIMSHVQQYTYMHLGKPSIGANARMAIWNVDRGGIYYNIEPFKEKMKFLFRGFWCCINAWLMKNKFPFVLTGAEKTSFLYEIMTSDLVFFSGGGYLTGNTISRLYDFCFVAEIANIFSVPVVLSGHNIGMWKSGFTKYIASHAFSKVQCITTRDEEESVNSLRDIGVTGKHVFVTHDDALFCDKLSDTSVLRRKCGIEKDDLYITFCPCLAKSEHQAGVVLRKLSKLLQWLLKNTTYVIVILPMSLEDRKIVERLYMRNKNKKLRAIHFHDYNFAMIRGIIGNSCFCVTMRHHPIIFSLGECVPVIAINFAEYFSKKNWGALQMFGQEQYCISMSEIGYLDKFILLVNEIQGGWDRGKMKERLYEVRKRKEQLYSIIKDIILR